MLWIVPTGLGALLGVAITAGEVERGTARISWSLSRARIRWLVVRSLPVGFALVVLLTLAAGFAEAGVRTRLLTDEPGFADYQLRTALVPARGLLALAVGLAAGAIIGRVLPALLVAIAFGAALSIGMILAFDIWHVASATFVPYAQMALDPSSYPLIPGTRAGFAGPGGEGVLVIQPSAFWAWVPLEAGAMVIVATAIWALAAGFVERRSP
jgi:hypothetical protein